MFRWITTLALVAIVFTASGLHKLGEEARATQPAQMVETSQSANTACCEETKEHKHSTCVAPYIVASSEGHCLSNRQTVVFVFHDDSMQIGAPASPLKRPPKPVL